MNRVYKHIQLLSPILTSPFLKTVFKILARALHDDPNITGIYINTSLSFSPSQLSLDRSILNRILVITCFHAYDLINALEHIYEMINLSNDSFFSNVAIVIVDSVAAVLLPWSYDNITSIVFLI